MDTLTGASAMGDMGGDAPLNKKVGIYVEKKGFDKEKSNGRNTVDRKAMSGFSDTLYSREWVDGLRNRKMLLLLFDLIVFMTIGVFLQSFGYAAETPFSDKLISTAFLSAFVFLTRIVFRAYRQVWRYAGSVENIRFILADFVGGCLYIFVTKALFGVPAWIIKNMPETAMLSWQAMAVIAVSCLASLSMRFMYQAFYRRYKLHEYEKEAAVQTDAGKTEGEEQNKINVAIVGAGSIGSLLASELLMNKSSHYRPYCFIDKDPQKVNNSIGGIMVYREDGILERLKHMPVQEIFIALPKLSGEDKQKKYEFYKQSGCKVKLYDFPYSDENTLKQNVGRRVLREFKIEDLLFRDSIHISNRSTGNYYKGKVVLITGGGGSIGSELCLQVAKYSPKQIIIFDMYENNAYDAQQDLYRLYKDTLDVRVEISSVRDYGRVCAVFEEYHPDVVLHAAAHKHVHLMEHNPTEAIKNNVFGTYNVANAAEKYGAKKFILISTDKAVNPTNIMGASKRICEMVVQSRADSRTEFAAVRFGNVLGSNGSVIPLFKNQIASGGPVTITDRRIIRYFMTIPEAAQLVLAAGAMAKDNELFVLDMGKPVKILELAENMIRLSGLKPYEDIEIIEVGLRPGEKLYEELLLRTEELDKTDNELIYVERDKPKTRVEVEEILETLRTALSDGSAEAVKSAVKKAVPTYRDPAVVNREAENSSEMKVACSKGERKVNYAFANNAEANAEANADAKGERTRPQLAFVPNTREPQVSGAVGERASHSAGQRSRRKKKAKDADGAPCTVNPDGAAVTGR